jgi:hypothetical protein
VSEPPKEDSPATSWQLHLAMKRLPEGERTPDECGGTEKYPAENRGIGCIIKEFILRPAGLCTRPAMVTPFTHQTFTHQKGGRHYGLDAGGVYPEAGQRPWATTGPIDRYARTIGHSTKTERSTYQRARPKRPLIGQTRDQLVEKRRWGGRPRVRK